MALLSKGTTPQPYGKGGRKVILPVKATAQIWQSAMVAQIAGACVTGTTAGAGHCVGIAEHDQLGGASDGAKRIELMTDQIFLLKAGTKPPTDATPFGTLLFMEDDNSVGVGGIGGTGEGIAGRFVGFEDDGRVRVWITQSGPQESFGCPTEAVNGAAITNTATSTVQRAGRFTRYTAPTLGQGTTVTLGTTGAVVGDVVRIVRTDTSAFTLAVVNGGTGAGTLATLAVSKVGFVQAYFDGTNWKFDGAAPT